MPQKDKSGQPQAPEPRSKAALAPFVTDSTGDPTPPLGNPGNPLQVGGRMSMSLTRAEVTITDDAALWSAIRNRTDAIRGDKYDDFITRVLCGTGDTGQPVCNPGVDSSPGQYTRSHRDLGAPVEAGRTELASGAGYGVDAYNLLKLATQAFLFLEAGVVIKRPRNSVGGESAGVGSDLVDGEQSRRSEEINFQSLKDDLTAYLAKTNGGLPYLDRILRALTSSKLTESPFCEGVLKYRFTCPSMLELIWSYWHEEGMLVQTMNAICMRFQNRRGPFERDPLANLEIDPLRPLNNLLWGYIQDEYNRLTVPRRAYEYDHHYGLKIVGKAVPELRSADSRSKFIEAFHNLLYRAASFYREDADTTVIADGFSLLSSLREVHLLLAEGAHNQFGDLPWTSRAEMMMMQWLLGRPEMREFLRGRAMVPYAEKWMGQVDTMKKLQGWTDTSITHFRNLAVYGEKILLSIRYGDWSEIDDQANAKTWARSFRPELQGYMHGYMSATGVDLSEDIVDTRNAPARYAQPSSLLEQRVMAQDPGAELQPMAVGRTLTPRVAGFGALPSARRRALNPARKE